MEDEKKEKEEKEKGLRTKRKVWGERKWTKREKGGLKMRANEGVTGLLSWHPLLEELPLG